MNKSSSNSEKVDKISSSQKLEEFLSLEENIKNENYEIIDLLFRKFILSKTQISPTTDYIFDLFVPYIKINYKNQNNQNIILDLFEKGFFIYAEELINKYSEIFNPSLKDSNDENCLMKILISQDENRKLQTFKKIFSLSKEHFNITPNNLFEIYSKRTNENLLTYSLLIGNIEISSILLENGASPLAKNEITGNNIIHNAVKGKNPYCLNLLLNIIEKYTLSQLISQKNNSNETPFELASKMNLNMMKKLLTEYSELNKNKSPEKYFNKIEIPIEFLVSSNYYNNKNTFEEKEKFINDHFYLNSWNEKFIDYLKLKKCKAETEEEENDGDALIEILRDLNFYFDHEEDIQNAKNNDLMLNYKEIYFYNSSTLYYKLNDYHAVLDIFKTFYPYSKEKKLTNEFIFQSNIIFILLDMSIKNKVNFLSKFYMELFTSYLREISGIFQKEKLNVENEKKEFKFITSNKTKWNYYLTFMNIINPSILSYNNSDYYIRQLTLLLLCYLIIEQKNYDKAKDYLIQIKKNFVEEKKNSMNKKIKNYFFNYQIYLKRLYKMIKIRLEYFQSNQSKNAFYKHLNSFKYFSNFSTESEINLFFYNTLGIKCLKEQKYSNALNNFLIAQKLIKNNYGIYQQYLPQILYNIALSNFYLRKYDRSNQIFIKLKKLDIFQNNPFLFFRLGLISVEKGKNEEKVTIRNDEVNSLIQKVFNEKCDKILLTNTTPKNLKSEAEESNPYFLEALHYFKQCLIIIKGDSNFINKCNKFYEEFQEISKNKGNILPNSLQIPFEKSQIKSFKKLYYLCYVNLLYCLIRTEQYSEVVFYCKDLFKKGEKNILVENYLIDAYLNMGEYKLASEVLLNCNLEEATKIKKKESFYSSSNKTLYSNVSYIIATLVNFAKVQILNNNLEEAKNTLMKVLSYYDNENKVEPPMYIINVIIYYLVTIGKIDKAIELLKHRKVQI